MHGECSIHNPWPNLIHESRVLWETSDPHSNPSFHSWGNLSSQYVMTCSKRKDPINSRARTKPWEIEILSTVSLSLLHTVQWAPEHPSCMQHLSLCFHRSPAVTGGAVLVAFYDHIPFVSFNLLLFEHPVRKYVFVLLILHLFLYFLQLC